MRVSVISSLVLPQRSKALLLGTVMSAALVQGGCSWFFGEDQPERVPAGTSTQGTGAYPNLGTVPQSGPAVTPAAQRRTLQEGLAADTANAAHTGEPLTGQDQNVPPAAAPGQKSTAQPATAAAPITPGEAPPAAQDTGDIFTPVGGQAVQPAGPSTATRPTQAPSTASSNPSGTRAPAAAAPAATAAPTPRPVATNPGQAVTVDYSAIGDTSAYAPQPWQGGTNNNFARAAFLPPGFAGVIYFGSGSSGLDNQDLNVLRDIAAAAQAQGYRIQIIGHSSLGTGGLPPSPDLEATNQRLSLARANSVAQALVRYGVPVQQVSVVGYGAGVPAYPEYDRNGEAANRRVEVFLF